MRLGEVMLRLRPNAELIGDTLRDVFVELGEGDDDEPAKRDTLESYYREVVRFTINWMARSDEEALRTLHAKITTQLVALGPNHPANRDLTEGEWLGMHLRGLTVVISTYLRTDNLAKLLGLVSGQRRRSWRRTLVAMFTVRRPVRAGDLVEMELLEQANTADYTLRQLAKEGLVWRWAHGPGAAYALTWSGEQVAAFLSTARSGDPIAEVPGDEVRGAGAPAPTGAGEPVTNPTFLGARLSDRKTLPPPTIGQHSAKLMPEVIPIGKHTNSLTAESYARAEDSRALVSREEGAGNAIGSYAETLALSEPVGATAPGGDVAFSALNSVFDRELAGVP
ncbi:hypothetical protein [Longimicrobium sp.]|uniref:hypothetical protein n=1 Tax=Longimicrobium sp. TaxID=2029185 RepID=UPI002EDB93B5